ncbi:T9SS type A sorting domain-containing protein [Hymenobacter sp. 15J16-1T3B]|uniref:T9SS type A sorting domain-containing protein n=1 Tax=Hymenobacter sp. 15J16-1T3B TaxID=2886941 RepID=UPI001D0F6CB2|nr:T9SS type A sorting domain-containing protein [Hymenobacter sp. 15J16-1T3B]MCC3158503.1 T9SS type A sorting domain-containing protein [Hymenobacter sp. 15J16-1T3B]
MRTAYVADTVIGGQSSQVLHATYTNSSQIWRMYTKADADRVWIYANGQFYKMHDFSARPGDSWTYQGPPMSNYHCGPTQLTVDSVGQQVIGGQLRRWFVVHAQLGPSLTYYRSARIYEGVGSLVHYLTPVSSACQAIDFGGLILAQCFSTAAQPGLIITGTMVNCQGVATGLCGNSKASEGFAVYPTVGPGELTVKLPAAYSRATVRVFSAAGQVVRQLAGTPDARLRLEQLPRGLYLVSVQQAGFPTLSRRIVLE